MRPGLLLLQVKGDKLVLKRDFRKDVAGAIKYAMQSRRGQQRLYVNPANRKLYVSENEGWVGGGDFQRLHEIDPETGKVREIWMPVKFTEDMTFDIDGNAYLRQARPVHRVLRYNSKFSREIPWDYGEQGKDGGKEVISGLTLPCQTPGHYSQGGLSVSPKGHLAVWCFVKLKNVPDELAHLMRKDLPVARGKPYEPRMYPGRKVRGCIHIWDKHGKVLIDDAVPGVTMTDGIGIDKDDNITMLSWIPRVFAGEKYFNWITGTLLKVVPGKNKWYSTAARAVPLTKARRPDRHPDISGYGMGNAWIEGVEWFYGGAGLCSFKISTGCICWQQSRFTLDYFARSFVPETDQFSVAVLDSNGNLIMRIGQYGNVDDGMPLAKRDIWNAEGKPGTPMLAPPHPRPLGGDEVALMHPSHVATMTDRRLYIGDVGNARVVQVKLGYHAEEKIALKDVPERE